MHRFRRYRKRRMDHEERPQHRGKIYWQDADTFYNSCKFVDNPAYYKKLIAKPILYDIFEDIQDRSRSRVSF